MSVKKMKKGDEVDFEKYMYVLKQGRFFFILNEPVEGKFIFTCFTQGDYAIGSRTDGVPVLAGFFDSAEEAINEIADFYRIYQFNNCNEYVKWLISALKIEF